MISCTRSADEFDWACLHDERAELLQSEVILEGTQVEVECRHIKVAVAVLCPPVIEWEHMLSLIIVKQILLIELQFEVGAFGQDLLDFSSGNLF